MGHATSRSYTAKSSIVSKQEKIVTWGQK